jgi:putative ABC transport system substrate-binding protein
VAVIVCADAPAAFAAKGATSTIPIVFAIGTDPVKVSLVDRFNRPVGNLTGVYDLYTGLASKHLELLRDLLPAARTVALFVNPSNPNAHVYVPEAQAAADTLGLHVEVLTVSAEGDLEAAFRIITRQRADALIMIVDPFFIAWRKQFTALAARWATPAIYPIRWFADVGGLMSYGAAAHELTQLMGTYIGKILQGARPADLPIQESAKFELIINLKTAKALGLTLPATPGPCRRGDRMRRRDFIMALAGATTGVSAVRGQEPRRAIGVLSALPKPTGSFDPALPGALTAFYQGLRETGFVEGRNMSIEYRWADGHCDRIPSLAAELVSRNVTVIWAFDLPSAFAAKAATKATPIVFTVGADPVKVGLVESFSRPTGNLSGLSVSLSVTGPKRVELLHELLSSVNTIAVLGNSDNPNFHPDVSDIQAAANALKQRLEVLTAGAESDLEAAFATMVRHRVGALIIMPDPLLISQREQLVALAARHTMPTIYPSRVFADLGGLISYGSSVPDLTERAGIYVGKILKGAKPADLPIQQSTKFELAINLKTAKALGLTMPASLLARADEVLE